MSNFVRSLADDELRVRQGFAFSVAASFTGAGVNPNNIVLFNATAGKVLWLFECRIVNSSANQIWTLFSLNANPGLTAAQTPVNRLLGGPAAVALVQGATAVTPANTGTLKSGTNATQVFYDILLSAPIMIQNGFGILWNSAAGGNLVTLNMSWYELPA